MKLNGKASASLAAALPASGQSMAASFYLTQVAPMSIGSFETTNTINAWGPDTAWTQPAGMVNLKEDTVGVNGLTLRLPRIEIPGVLPTELFN